VNDPKGRIEMFSIVIGNNRIIGPEKLDGGLEEAEFLARQISHFYKSPVALKRTVIEEWEINGLGGAPQEG
jgi:hypothetical protein